MQSTSLRLTPKLYPRKMICRGSPSGAIRSTVIVVPGTRPMLLSFLGVACVARIADDGRRLSGEQLVQGLHVN